MSTSDSENLQADVVVVGSGGGLSAAVIAAEGGASVILLEKENILGGYTRQANALFACESPLQKRQKVTITTDDLFRRVMAWNHWYRVDARVVRAYINQSGKTIQWLEENGVEFELITNHSGLPIIHMPSDMMASVQKTLIKRAEELGVKSLLRMSGKRIVRGAEDKVIGVVAVDREGAEFEIKTSSVVIATGGFGDNRELLRKYCVDYHDKMRLWDWPHHTAHSGDGIYMAEEIGAAIAEAIPIYHRAGPDFGDRPWAPAIPMSMSARMIRVNKKGRRFTDEVGASNYESGNPLYSQPDMVAYAIFGDDLIQAMEAQADKPGDKKPEKHAKSGGGAVFTSEDFSGLREKVLKLVTEDKLKAFDSWDEMATWIGCNPGVLKAEMEGYNSFCDKSRDEMFAKDPQYLVPMRNPPYYGIQFYAEVGETLGGIKVDGNMAVLDKEGDIIPGVFSAGVIADGHQGQTYCAELGGSPRALQYTRASLPEPARPDLSQGSRRQNPSGKKKVYFAFAEGGITMSCR